MPETCIRFGELAARVMIEEKEVPHYNIHVDASKKEVTCWIASEAGKSFSVVWLKLEKPVEYPSGGALYLDGHCAESIQRSSAYSDIIFDSMTISESSCVPFLFSPLVVTDDDTYLETPSHSIGEIKLVISRTTVPEDEPETHQFTYLPPRLDKVHERSKKAIGHRVNYGSEIPTQVERVSSEDIETLVTFIFKYRPLEMLRANDIVPQNSEFLEPQEHLTAETSSGKGKHFKVEKEVEFGSEDEDSIREKTLLAELERIRTRKGRHRDLKDSERPRKRLKMEEKPLFTPGEIIDLT